MLHYYYTVRSGAIRPSVRPVFRYPKSGGRDPSPKVPMVSIIPKQLKEKAKHRTLGAYD